MLKKKNIYNIYRGLSKFNSHRVIETLPLKHTAVGAVVIQKNLKVVVIQLLK